MCMPYAMFFFSGMRSHEVQFPPAIFRDSRSELSTPRLQADSYRWLLDMNETEAFGRGFLGRGGFR